MMSCHHCNTKFNFFHKELGCANCGLSLCSKCLQQKCKIPSKGEAEFKVCRVCFPKLNKQSQGETFAPPDRFLKRLENLENPSAAPITVYRENPKVTALKAGLSPDDQAIVDRLEKLKEKQSLPPSDSDLKERLANLKGVPYRDSLENKQSLFTLDLRSDQEKADSLMEQYSNQQGIDASYQSHDDIGQRLAVLKGEDYKKNEVSSDEELDSEAEVDQITKKIMSQVSLEERCPLGSSKKPTSSSDDDDDDIRSSSPELPWCVLCNKDATHKCNDCGGDLYCSSCNIEVHKDWGDTDHRVVPYKQK
ncbi:abscission/NoCut checkpoint regulator [Euwallacea similis]|uniref:abscission/NoCut checkpoint regulator n=1 Tax=Euwallacea similis TaxID=1736056 RepID=UPI00344FEBDA